MKNINEPIMKVAVSIIEDRINSINEVSIKHPDFRYQCKEKTTLLKKAAGIIKNEFIKDGKQNDIE